jgi:carbohydrate-binding DOMON domain-containing protein
MKRLLLVPRLLSGLLARHPRSLSVTISSPSSSPRVGRAVTFPMTSLAGDFVRRVNSDTSTGTFLLTVTATDTAGNTATTTAAASVLDVPRGTFD